VRVCAIRLGTLRLREVRWGACKAAASKTRAGLCAATTDRAAQAERPKCVLLVQTEMRVSREPHVTVINPAALLTYSLTTIQQPY
jgi:hypothetical protein